MAGNDCPFGNRKTSMGRTCRCYRKGDGKVYERSIYAQSACEYTYRLNGRYATFAAAAGMGTTKPDASVEFVVVVDGV